MCSRKKRRRKHKSGEVRKEDPNRHKTDSETAGGPDQEERKIRWREFSGPTHVDEPIRVAFRAEAYADLIEHTKVALDSEICGVLVGEFCEDDEGLHVAVDAIIRGMETKRGGAHVTYTQETWNKVHEAMEREHPGRQIVGWYHSHPGFGVAFSENDLFIQQNFFAGRGQIGYVADPLGGEEAICVNTPQGIRHASRFWVDGRERRCWCPSEGESGTGAGAPAVEELREALETVQTRLRQVLQALEEQRATTHRTVLSLGMLVAVAIIVWIGYTIYDSYASRMRPPKLVSFDRRVPVVINGRTHWFGISVVGWQHPEELQALFVSDVIRKLAELEKARLEKEKQEQQQQQSPPGGTSEQKTHGTEASGNQPQTPSEPDRAPTGTPGPPGTPEEKREDTP